MKLILEDEPNDLLLTKKMNTWQFKVYAYMFGIIDDFNDDLIINKVTLYYLSLYLNNVDKCVEFMNDYFDHIDDCIFKFRKYSGADIFINYVNGMTMEDLLIFIGYKTVQPIREVIRLIKHNLRMHENLCKCLSCMLDLKFIPESHSRYCGSPSEKDLNDFDRIRLNLYVDFDSLPSYIEPIKVHSIPKISIKLGLKSEYDVLCEKSTPIEDLDFSVRTYNVLKRAGLHTVYDITLRTEEELKKIRNLGKHSFEEIINKLRDLNLGLSKEDK